MLASHEEILELKMNTVMKKFYYYFVLELKMNIVMKKFYYYLLLGYFVLTFPLPCLAMTTTNITTDQLSLLALKAKITSDPSQTLANNWSITSSVCDWIGVTCGSRHRRVTALDISNWGLDGTVPPQLGNMSFLVSLNMSENGFHGDLPHELALLRRLRVLDLGINNFVGDFPSWIGCLKKLQYLSLRNNSFTGFIPPSISNMSNLKTLWLSYNSLQGTIPLEIGNLNKLKTLKISNNQLSGSLPLKMFNISSLETIGFHSNSLSGSLPVNICLYLPGLTWLGFSANKLSGMIPSTISHCSKLQVLWLYENHFSGQIPAEFGNLTVLELLYLDDNNLNGTIPQELGNLQNLRVLAMSSNSLTGCIPVQLFNISTLEQLFLGFNNLSGNLPSTLGYGLINLERLYLTVNEFVGEIPASISNASNLAYLDFSANNFSGLIPNSLGDLRHLRELILFQNFLTIERSSTELRFISYLMNSKYLRILDLGDNPLHGIFPLSVGNLSTYLEQLYAYSCEIKGRIPEGIGNLSTLVVLSLFENQLNGPVPDTVKGLQNLQALDITENQLSGSIPDSLCKLKSLYGIRLSRNQFQGSIPSCLSNISSLREIFFAGNVLNASIPSSLWNLNDLLILDLSTNSLVGSLPQEIQNLKVVTVLDLSGNQIYGSIPTSIGGLQTLANFSLAQNQLEGPIPDSLSHMLSLQFLDLSRNNLSGSIPRSLEKLSYLTYINLSFNNLRGEIPSGGPFKNFTSQSFMFNELLCGAPRFLVPPCSTSMYHKSGRKKIFQQIYILSGILATIVALTSTILIVRYRRKNEVPTTFDLLPRRAPERISYYELLQATNGFDHTNLLGSGSFGFVYKGARRDGMLVAVKVFSLQTEGISKSFDTECKVLGNLRHRNITKVIGCCSNLDFKALVLEYMCNGSLERWLYSHNYYLNLMQRLNIIIDVACGLQYLHYGYTMPVVHCDLKPSNILLDANMVAHVTDFGVAKFLEEGNSVIHTKNLATLGYIAPEYALGGQVSTKTDVYSFGIVLMETFSRMKPNDDMFSEDMSLKSWIKDSLTNAIFQVIDANLLRPEDKHFTGKLECISLIFQLALNCCTGSPRDRINMVDIVASLGKIKHQLQRFCEES